MIRKINVNIEYDDEKTDSLTIHEQIAKINGVTKYTRNE